MEGEMEGKFDESGEPKGSGCCHRMQDAGVNLLRLLVAPRRGPAQLQESSLAWRHAVLVVPLLQKEGQGEREWRSQKAPAPI